MHLLNQFPDPTKGADARLEMKRLHHTLGRSSKHAFGIAQSILTQLLAKVGCSVRGLRDAALLQLAYDTLCRRSELVSLQLCDLRSHELAGVIHNSILPLRTKVGQESVGRWLALCAETMLAIERAGGLPLGSIGAMFCEELNVIADHRLFMQRSNQSNIQTVGTLSTIEY